MRWIFTPYFHRAGSLILAFGLLATAPSYAQAPDSLATLGRKLGQYQRQALVEQLFLHLDRPAYVAGETLWFKAYAVEGTAHRPLTMSKVAYVEVLDAAQRPVLRAKIALVQAMGQGAFELPPDLPTGRYTVRAYTNWMKNAGPAFYFHCPITVVNTLQGMPVAPSTAQAGPVYGIQFFPEGGQLVRGLPGRVAFKVTDQQGNSVAAAGTVTDATGTTVASFQTLKLGLGSFLLTPAAAGAAYQATVRLPGGAVVTSKLPAVAEQGYALLVTDDGPTQLTVAVQTQPSGALAEPLRLLAHTGQQVTVAATAALTAGRATFQVDKRSLRPGITHFTVFSGQRPVGERLYFRRPSHQLVIQGKASAAAYGPRSRVQLQVGAAQPAALSLAVYRLDSLATAAAADISSYLLLAADLPGFIEDAGYYFRDSSATAQLAADNLMLTQGWRRFKWEDVVAGQAPTHTYPPELNGYLLQGRISQPTGAPASGIPAYLSLPGRNFKFASSLSRVDGVVQFEMPDFYGLRKLVFQTNSMRDSTYHIELLSPFTAGGGGSAPGLAPLSVRFTNALSERHLQVQTQREFQTQVPRYRAVPGDTLAFYGQPDEQFRLDDYTRFPSLEDVMREYVPAVLVRKRKDGFHFVVIDRPRHINLKDNPLTLIDGLPVFNINQLVAFDPLKIKRLEVIANRYFLGQQVYDGVVSFSTYKGDLAGFPLNPHALIEEYEAMQVPREFYTPHYDTEAQQRSRLPDLRNLLYWNPDVRLTAGQPQTLDFFTSDQAGRYLVVAQGLTKDGQLGSTSFTLDVKPTL
ncbi:Plug domain-containing protein [Hymenobacter arcticus]